MYDIIGDIHGHAAALKELLHKMDYRLSQGIWQHSSRKVIFVGDYIDRGPAIRETLSIVHNMKENGQAIALMGNHEYNALAYNYKLSNGSFLREHNDLHNYQHEQTIKQFNKYQDEWMFYLKWFYTLPLFVDLPQMRAVHACWDERAIQWLRDNKYKTLNEDLLISSHYQSSDSHSAITSILKGKEYNIPKEYAWKDKDGHLRTKNRYKWWINSIQSTYGQFLFNCPIELRDQIIKDNIQANSYPTTEKPVFFGHYWMDDPYPAIQTSNVICLDYSIAKGGSLVAYRWNESSQISNSHFISVDSYGC